MVCKQYTAWFVEDNTKQPRDKHQVGRTVGKARRKDHWKATMYEQLLFWNSENESFHSFLTWLLTTQEMITLWDPWKEKESELLSKAEWSFKVGRSNLFEILLMLEIWEATLILPIILPGVNFSWDIWNILNNHYKIH